MGHQAAKSNPFAELAANVAQPFEQARAMPTSVYTDEAFAQAELDQIFKQDWFCVTRSDALPNPGDYTTLDLAGQPIMVIRGSDGVLRAQSNVCLHRMSTLLEGSGNTTTIVCPYHAWTYGIDGKLRGAPAMSLNNGFCKDGYALPQVRCEEWLGWVMVTLNPDAAPVANQLSQVAEMSADFEMQNYQQTFFETHVWNTNWKVLAENFMESYHLPVCHAATVGSFSKLEDMVCPPGEAAFNYHWIYKEPEFHLANAHPNNNRMEGDRRRLTYLFSIYPSLLITLTPGYFWYLSLHPQGPGQVQIRFGGGMAPEFMDDPQAVEHFNATKALLDDVNVEDRHCTEKVYKGLCSDNAVPGHLSHLERPNYDFAHYIHSRVKA